MQIRRCHISVVYLCQDLGRTVYEEQLETKFSRETENVFTLSLYYDVDGISEKETVVACSTEE